MINFILRSLFLILLCFDVSASSEEITKLENKLASSSDPQKKVEIYLELAIANSTVNIEKAIKYGSDALELSRKLNNSALEAKSLLSLAESHLNNGNYDTAINYVFPALEIYEQSKDPVGLINGYGNLGLIYIQTGDLERAEKHYIKAMAQLEYVDDPPLEAAVYSAMARIYTNKKEFDKAFGFAEKSLAVLENHKTDPTYIVILANMGLAKKSQGDSFEAEKFYRQALALAKKGDKPYYTIHVLKRLAQLGMDTGDLHKAETNALESYELAKELNSDRLLEFSTNFLSILYEKMNNSRKSLEYYKLNVKYKNILFNAEKSAQILEVQGKYESDKKDAELKLNQEVINSQKNTNYAIFGLMVLFAIFSIITFRFSVVRKRDNKKLKKQSVELESANKHLEKANTQLEELSLTDQLTGLRNRRFLQNYLKSDVDLILRMNSNTLAHNLKEKPKDSDLIFFLIDLDHFKKVNDVHGHTAGDSVLIQIKSILEQVFRDSDHFVRWGGEEFLVITRFSNREYAPMLAEKLRQSVEAHDFDIGQGKTLKKTCSIGFACFPFLTNNPEYLVWEQVVDIADHCMYAAKKSNRNAWVGLSNINCSEDNIFLNITEQTKKLIDLKQLEVESSIADKSLLKWD